MKKQEQQIYIGMALKAVPPIKCLADILVDFGSRFTVYIGGLQAGIILVNQPPLGEKASVSSKIRDGYMY
jgi:hypothetical protein